MSGMRVGAGGPGMMALHAMRWMLLGIEPSVYLLKNFRGHSVGGFTCPPREGRGKALHVMFTCDGTQFCGACWSRAQDANRPGDKLCARK